MPEYSYMCEGCGHKWTVFRHMSEYKPKEECPECAEIESVFRDFEEDNIYGGYSYSLSETKTLGHYADKQSEKYGKWKCEDMKRDFKTKKTQGGGDLPTGMSRMEKPQGGVQWTKDQPKKKKRKRNR